MSVSTTTVRIGYTANGTQTAFTYPFEILSASEIGVYSYDTTTKVETKYTLTTHYSVSGILAPAGGTVTFLTAPTSGLKIVLVRESVQDQPIDITTGGPIPSENTENALDQLTLEVQELADKIRRAPLLPVTSSVISLFDLVFPKGDSAVPMYIRWNSTGTALEAVSTLDASAVVGGVPVTFTAFGRDFVDSADAAAARLLLGLTTIPIAEIYGVDSGSSDAYAITLSPAPAAYTAGMIVNFKANTVNTGACTINVNGLGAKAIKKHGTTDPTSSDIVAGQVTSLIYDGTNFQIVTNNPWKGGTSDSINFIAGSVGIGITAPTYRLCVGNETAAGAFKVADSGDIDVTGGSDSVWGLFKATVGIFSVEATNKVNFAQNVGFGVTAPAALLSVGNETAGGAFQVGVSGDIVVSGGSDSNWSMYKGATEILFNAASGHWHTDFFFGFNGVLPGAPVDAATSVAAGAGIRIRADSGGADAILQFTNTSASSQRAAIVGDASNQIRADSAKFIVNSVIKIAGGSPGVGKVLTSDAAGDATWVALPSTQVIAWAVLNTTAGLGAWTITASSNVTSVVCGGAGNAFTATMTAAAVDTYYVPLVMAEDESSEYWGGTVTSWTTTQFSYAMPNAARHRFVVTR